MVTTPVQKPSLYAGQMLLLAFGFLTICASGSANAALIYDLTADWSNSGLPMAGVWDLRNTDGSLAAVSQIEELPYPVSQRGYQSEYGHWWFKSDFDGSAVGDAFSTGDVIASAPARNHHYSVWTSDSNAVVDVHATLWDVHGGDVPFDHTSAALMLNEELQDSLARGFVTHLNGRDNPLSLGATGVRVSKGDEIALLVQGETYHDPDFGPVAPLGITYTISSRSVPEPGALLLLLVGIAGASIRSRIAQMHPIRPSPANAPVADIHPGGDTLRMAH